MVVRNQLILIEGAPAGRNPVEVETYPSSGANQVYQGCRSQGFSSKPVSGVDGRRA
jgi:hypothetical protein